MIWNGNGWRLAVAALWGVALGTACTDDGGARPASPGDAGADAGPPRGSYAITETASYDVCPFIGRAGAPPGVYGSDLGITFDDPDASDRLRIMFGDTWPDENTPCSFPTPTNDDLQGTLPRARPASFVAGPPENVECPALVPIPAVTTGFSPMRLHGQDGTPLSLGFGRTPLSGFTDGKRVFGIFTRGQSIRCDVDADCGGHFVCTSDPGFQAKRPGQCEPPLGLVDGDSVALCLEDAECGARRACAPQVRGYCVSQDPFFVEGPDGPVSPPWYRDDPRTGLALYNYVAVASDPAAPDVFQTGARVTTHRFANLSTRTVRHFDPDHPEKNDYRPGNETLLVWGRGDFSTKRGKQAPMYFAYQPLADFVKTDGTLAWAPRYFAGYGESGTPRWADDEFDAVPVQGTSVTVTRGDDGALAFDWHEPEFDIVQQFSLSWVEPLGEWLMVYGGSIPAWIRFDTATNSELPIVHQQPHPGAIHYREAAHPWGRATKDSPESEAWTAPKPLGTPEELAAELGCGDLEPKLPGCRNDRDPHRPLQLGLALADRPGVTEADAPDLIAACLDGTAGATLQYNLSGDAKGNLYAPFIIESWTNDVSASTPGLAPDEKVVEIYWDVSTWNPYQVVLAKTALHAKTR